MTASSQRKCRDKAKVWLPFFPIVEMHCSDLYSMTTKAAIKTSDSLNFSPNPGSIGAGTLTFQLDDINTDFTSLLFSVF